MVGKKSNLIYLKWPKIAFKLHTMVGENTQVLCSIFWQYISISVQISTWQYIAVSVATLPPPVDFVWNVGICVHTQKTSWNRDISVEVIDWPSPIISQFSKNKIRQRVGRSKVRFVHNFHVYLNILIKVFLKIFSEYQTREFSPKTPPVPAAHPYETL